MGLASDVLQRAQASGLMDRHWIVDTARAAAAVENPNKAADLLRQSVEVHVKMGLPAMTSCTRLRMALAETLCKQGGKEALQEAASLYSQAAETLALLFGDDHREHQDAMALRDRALARCRQVAAVPTSKNDVISQADSRNARKGPSDKKQQKTLAPPPPAPLVRGRLP